MSENAAASVAMKKIIMVSKTIFTHTLFPGSLMKVEFPETAVWLSGEEDKEQEKVIVSSSKALTRFSSL